MATIQTQLYLNTINVSVQIGDMIYYTTPNNSTNHNFQAGTLNNTKLFGEVIFVGQNTITVQWDDSSSITAPQQGDFISFVKNKKINTSSLVGYYAEANFVNDSKEKIELFTVGSQVVRSSK